MDYVRRAVCGIQYADDGCIVSRSPQGLAKIMYRGGAVTRTPDLSVEIARRYLRKLYDRPKVALSTFRPKITPNSASYTLGSCFASSGHSARDQIIGWPRTIVPLR